MKKIKVSGIEGYYYIEDGYLIYCYYFNNNNIKDCSSCEVSDLSDLTIYQYNELVKAINNHYPTYNISILRGRFI